MRYVVGFVSVLALLASPLSVSAQAEEEGATQEPKAEEPAPTSEPEPREPALKMELHDAGVEVAPSPPRTPDGYTYEELRLKARRAQVGIGVSAGVFVGGIVMGAIALGEAAPFSCILDCPPTAAWAAPVGAASAFVIVGGLVAMIVSANSLGRSQQELRKLEHGRHKTPRRAQWDLARSRLVF